MHGKNEALSLAYQKIQSKEQDKPPLDHQHNILIITARKYWRLSVRPNPTYQLLKTENFPFSNQLIESTDSENNPFILIPLKRTEAVISLDNRTYKSTTKQPHLSFYEKRHKDEKQARTTYHFTWYLQYQEQTFTLHLYFGYHKEPLYSHIKNTKNKIISHFDLQSNPEKMGEVIRIYETLSSNTINLIFDQINKKHQQLDSKSQGLLKELETLSKNLDRNLKEYIDKAKLCHKLFIDKAYWAFSEIDAIGSYLERMIPLLSEKKEETHVPKSSGGKQARKTNQKNSNTIPTIPNKLEIPNPELQTINAKINQLKQAKKDPKIESELLTLQNKKFEILLNPTVKTTDKELIETLSEIQKQQESIDKLFLSAMQECNQSTAEILIGQLTKFPIQATYYAIFNNQLNLVQALLEKFTDEFLRCLNYFIFGSSQNKNMLTSYLHTTLQNNDTKMLLLFLKSGANPNIAAPNLAPPIITSIKENKLAHLKCLLQYGANPNPLNSIQFGYVFEINSQNNSKKITQQALQLGKANKTADFTITSEESPLHTAVLKRDLVATSLLLEYGASITLKDKNGFTAMGIATCDINPLPTSKDNDLLNLLIQHGTNIDEIQVAEKSDTNALKFAYQATLNIKLNPSDQKNLNERFKYYLEILKADPNLEIKQNINIGNADHSFQLSVLQLAIFESIRTQKNHTCIGILLGNQYEKRLSMRNLLIAASILLFQGGVLNRFNGQLDIVTNSNNNFYLTYLTLCNIILTLEATVKMSDQLSHINKDATTAHNSKNHYDALFRFGTQCFSETYDIRLNAILHIGICYHHVKNYQAAKMFYSIVLNKKPNKFVDTAKKGLESIEKITSKGQATTKR